MKRFALMFLLVAIVLVGIAIAGPMLTPRAASCAEPSPFAVAEAQQAGLLPGYRIVSFYGNPRSARMGILGALARDSMIRRLHAQAAEYAKADPATPVLPALHLVTVVAQRDPGRDGLYRGRMPDSLVEEVASWAGPDSLLLFLDIQPGGSSVVDEVRPYLDFLKRPYVHLALDPEFVMAPNQVPGRQIGSLDAADVNRVIELLADMVESHGLPPKILIVHRFTEKMLTGYDRIRLDPRVQLVINMDGFGPPALKRDSYRCVVASQPVQFTGFKLFYQQDVPLMSPKDVLALRPAPLVVMYQ
jgi:hypothetical protein